MRSVSSASRTADRRHAHQVTQSGRPEQNERHAELEPPEAGKAESGHHETGPGYQTPAVLMQPHLPHGSVIPTQRDRPRTGYVSTIQRSRCASANTQVRPTGL